MATICATRPVLGRNETSPPPSLSLHTSQRAKSTTPVPNKHIPYCSPGPQPSPPSTPLSSPQLVETTSLTYPPSAYDRVTLEPPVYSIKAVQLEQAINHLASQALPSASQVFPWLHGLHAENQLQLAFFVARKKSLRRTPKCIRGITVVKARGDLSHSKLKGAVAPEELLRPVHASPRESKKEEAGFWEADPKDGFSVRNFQIQACKMATVSDIVVYGDDRTPHAEVLQLAKRISKAQTAWQKRQDSNVRLFNTFVLSDKYEYVETDHPDLIALDSEGCLTGKVPDFSHWERREMCSMSAPTEICHNVWLGPTPDQGVCCGSTTDDQFRENNFDIMIEASDVAQIPDSRAFTTLERILERMDQVECVEGEVPQLEFPGSGAILPPTWSQTEVDGLMATCEWMHKMANTSVPDVRKRRDSKLSLSPSPERDTDGDSFMHGSGSSQPTGRKMLIHCADGYTESTLLALAYFMYDRCVPVHDAWLQLHRDLGRNFFAYASDVQLLRAIQPRILQSSPKHSGDLSQLCPKVPDWLDKLDGSLPSRILEYMYLGNLAHANNPSLLKELGIGQILSVGEPVSWSQDLIASWPKENLLFVDKVQDNGVDPLTEEFGRCLEFIENGRRKDTATLVHCRVGVSRSATICIAEVMNELGLSFPRAYCYVRARRLNVIIQPHLRFSYELLKWEEFQCQKRGRPLRRELEWATIAREIAAMNKPYARQG